MTELVRERDYKKGRSQNSLYDFKLLLIKQLWVVAKFSYGCKNG